MTDTLAAPRYCYMCGTGLQPGQAYCRSCGAKVAVVPVAAASTSKPFWESSLGRGIRWVALLPAGFVILYVAEVLAILMVQWVASWGLGTLILLAVIFGIGGIILTLIWMAGSFAGFLVGMIAPNRKVGTLLFLGVYGCYQLLTLFAMAADGAWLMFFTAVVVTIAAVVALVQVYEEG